MKNNNNQYNSQEISWKNYNPFIQSLNELLNDMLKLGAKMYSDPIAIEQYFIHIKNINVEYSSFFLEKEDINIRIEEIGKFFNSNLYLDAIYKYKSSGGRITMDPKTIRNLNITRDKLLNIFKEMNEYFSINGLTPRPEKREIQLWEKEKNSSLKLRKKAVLQIIFGD